MSRPGPDQPEAAAITPERAAVMRRGDIVSTRAGERFYAWSARFGRLEVMPLQDGQPVVHAGSGVRFALDEACRQAHPEYRSEPLFLVEQADEESAAEAPARPAP